MGVKDLARADRCWRVGEGTGRIKSALSLSAWGEREGSTVPRFVWADEWGRRTLKAMIGTNILGWGSKTLVLLPHHWRDVRGAISSSNKFGIIINEPINTKKKG